MEIAFRLCLPRDASSVPTVRRLLSSTMHTLGIEDDCVNDIEVAVTEACTNVLKHAVGSAEEYEVEVELNHERAQISVIDAGYGFDASIHGSDIEMSRESGRGILLMKALVDTVEFKSEPRAGTIVNLTKALSLTPSSIL